MNMNKIIIAFLLCAGVSSLTQCAAQSLSIEKRDQLVDATKSRAVLTFANKTNRDMSLSYLFRGKKYEQLIKPGQTYQLPLRMIAKEFIVNDGIYSLDDYLNKGRIKENEDLTLTVASSNAQTTITPSFTKKQEAQLPPVPPKIAQQKVRKKILTDEYDQMHQRSTGVAFIRNNTRYPFIVEYQNLDTEKLESLIVRNNEFKLLLPIKDLGRVRFKTPEGIIINFGGPFGSYRWYEGFFKRENPVNSDGLAIALRWGDREIEPSVEIIPAPPMARFVMMQERGREEKSPKKEFTPSPLTQEQK